MKGFLFCLFSCLVCGLVLSAAEPAVAGGSCAGGACQTATLEVPVVVGVVARTTAVPAKIVVRIAERKPVRTVIGNVLERKPIRTVVGTVLERKPARRALAGIVRALRR